MFVAAQHGFRSIIGVELDTRLAAIADNNIRAYAATASSRDCTLSVVAGDAACYEFPSVSAVVFLFNPFGAGTLRAVVANLERSLATTPRPVVVAYFNPVHREVLDTSPTLRATASTRDWTIYQN